MTPMRAEGSAGPLHRWTKPPQRWVPPNTRGKVVMTTQEAVDHEASKLFGIWGKAPLRLDISVLVGGPDQMPEIPEERVREVVRSVKNKTALGPDSMHPKRLAWISPEGVSSLTALVRRCEQELVFPSECSQVAIALIPKTGGGGQVTDGAVRSTFQIPKTSIFEILRFPRNNMI